MIGLLCSLYMAVGFVFAAHCLIHERDCGKRFGRNPVVATIAAFTVVLLWLPIVVGRRLR